MSCVFMCKSVIKKCVTYRFWHRGTREYFSSPTFFVLPKKFIVQGNLSGSQVFLLLASQKSNTALHLLKNAKHIFSTFNFTAMYNDAMNVNTIQSLRYHFQESFSWLDNEVSLKDKKRSCTRKKEVSAPCSEMSPEAFTNLPSIISKKVYFKSLTL